MTRTSGDRNLLTAEQTAELLGINVRMVRRLTEQRRLPFVKVGRLVRFRPADVERCVEEWTVAAVERPAHGWAS